MAKAVKSAVPKLKGYKPKEVRVPKLPPGLHTSTSKPRTRPSGGGGKGY